MEDRSDALTEAEAQQFAQLFRAMNAEIGRVVLGQQEVVHSVLVALVAGGHVLLEGPPGDRVAWDGARLHPLVARYESSAAARARRLLAREAPARDLADGAARIAMRAGWLRNVNRLSDLS